MQTLTLTISMNTHMNSKQIESFETKKLRRALKIYSWSIYGAFTFIFTLLSYYSFQYDLF